MRELERFSPVRRLYPILVDASSLGPPDMGQDWATLGENLGAGGSGAELAPPLICLRASAAIFGPHGWSELAVEALYAGAGRAWGVSEWRRGAERTAQESQPQLIRG